MAQEGRTFRIFVSSTFSDMKEERNALQQHVFPRLRELCERHGARFQAIDLRWGVSQQASRDQQTMNICLGEIARCQEVTPRPNFVVLLGDRYGWCPPPPQIPADEFERLLECLTTTDRRLLHWEEDGRDLGDGVEMVHWDPDTGTLAGDKGWYRHDDNAVPAEYVLQPWDDYSYEEWEEIEGRLRWALETAAKQAGLDREAQSKYWASATHQEIAAGALQVENPQDKVFCFFRSLRDLPEGLRPSEFLALVEARYKALDRTLSSPAVQCLTSIRHLGNDASPRDIHDLIVQAQEEASEESAADLTLLDGWLRDATAFDYRDLESNWRPDQKAQARLEVLKEQLSSRVAGNVFEYEAQWTQQGPAIQRVGTLPDDLDASLALLDAPERPKTLCATTWRNLARAILRELEHPIERPTPREGIRVAPDEDLDAEGRAHCDFANGLLHHFVGRGDPLQAISDYLASEQPRTLAVVAEGGAGKSALMAKALEQARDAQSQAHIVYRFIGATPSSSDGRSLLVGLCQEISRRYGDDEEVPYSYTDLVPELTKRMAVATPERPLILFLDALDQISEAHGARRLTWLPRRLPEHVWVVLSTRREEETFEALTQHQPQLVTLEAMSRENGQELLGLWLDDASRTLSLEQWVAVLDAFEHERSGSRPLYLKLASEEARLWPSYAPPEDLEPGLEGVIRENLFYRLARERNHGMELVARTAGYLAASRYGLAEDELVDVLSRDVDLYLGFLEGSFHIPSDLMAHAVAYRRSCDTRLRAVQGEKGPSPESWLRAVISDPERGDELRKFLHKVLPTAQGPRLPVVLWSRLYFDLDPYLTRRRSEGVPLIGFYHRELDDVSREDYADGERGRELHGRLADYFRSRADPDGDGTWQGHEPRGLSELPYHLTEAARWHEVFTTLTDFCFLEQKAAEVGVEASGGDGEGETVYTGVLQLQGDYERALRKMPGGSVEAGGRRPLIVTAVDLGEGLMVRCPWCNTEHPVTEERRPQWLGEVIACPNEGCEGKLKVNPIIAGGSRQRRE